MKFATPFVVAAALAALHPTASLSAQEKEPTARQFLYDEYRTVMFGNFKLMRDTGIWDELTASALKLIVGMIEKELSFPLARLDRVTSVQRPRTEAGVDAAEQRSVEQVAILEGNGDLGDATEGGRYQIEKFGVYDLMIEQWSGDAVLQFKPTFRVYGPAEQIKEVLGGKPRAGLPSADVLSFIAGKKQLLAYFVADVKNHRAPRESLQQILPDAGWPEDDKPTHMCIRLLATGDEDDPHLTLEWAVRHGKDGEGLVATEKAVAAALQRLRELKEARILRPLLKKVTSERDGTDGVWRVDLGRARQAMGLLGTLAPFMFFTSSSEVQVQGGALAPVQVELVEEAPKPKKEEAGGEKAKAKAKKPAATKKAGATKKAQAIEVREVPVTTGGGE